AAPGAASEPVRAIRVAYEAVDGCPASDAFVGEIRARTPLVRIAQGAETAVEIAVRVAREEGGARGRLELRMPDGEPSARGLVGATCEQVVSGLALIAAVALDPNASVAALVSPAPEPVPAPPGAVPTRAQEPPPDRPAPVPPPRGASKVRWTIGARGE